VLRATGGMPFPLGGVTRGGASRQPPVGSRRWCHVSWLGGDRGYGAAYCKHNDDDVIVDNVVVVEPRRSALHGHHVAECDVAQLARGVVACAGSRFWWAVVVVCRLLPSLRVVVVVVRRSRSFVARLSCGGGCG
jgi:hypothetical protein